MLTHSKLALVIASLSLSSALVLSGCAADATAIEDSESTESEPTDENVGSAQQATSNGWTAFTTDGAPPIYCDPGNLITHVHCTGRYCDNIQVYCQPTAGGTAVATRPTNYFTDGSPAMVCNSDEWVTGLGCTGDYCDNVQLQCTRITGASKGSCVWTGWVSEEYGGYLVFPTGYYMVGAQCSGDFCDNMRFQICQKL